MKKKSLKKLFFNKKRKGDEISNLNYSEFEIKINLILKDSGQQEIICFKMMKKVELNIL